MYDFRETSTIYRITSSTKILALQFESFYTKDKEKRTPCNILNETIENRKWFLIGFYAADGNRRNKQKITSFSQKK